jgi:DNA modification methylase
MAKKTAAKSSAGGASVPASREPSSRATAREDARPTSRLKSSSLLDTRVVYCGDNLEQLAKLPDACVDLIYIDPPFNSNRNYEVFWGETKEKRAFEDRHENTKAYIDYMRPRCVQLARVLKKTGSFYYHCDWHASHYVKVMLDQILGENNFLNEIIWQRSDAHNDATQQFPVVSDSIFLYTGGGKHFFEPQHVAYPTKTLKEWYLWLELADGSVRRMTKDEIATQAIPVGARRFNTADLSAPVGGGMAAINKKTGKPNGWYLYKGYEPPANGWRHSPERMAENDAKGLLLFPSEKTGRIMFKRYLDEQEGPVLGNVWTDIDQLRANDAERLGYPTQKPLALLDRIIKASSNPNDIVLDAFCGCGTALVAAQNLKRQWIGIDISPTSCRVMAKRLRDVCGLPESEPLWKAGRGFVVRDLPWSEEKLRAIPPFEFENWAVIALGGIPNKVQVGDMGVDGRIYPVSSAATPRKKQEGELALKERWYPIQVKQKDKVGRPDIDSFEAMMMREDCDIGFIVSFDYSSDAMTEIGNFFKRTGKIIRAFTVRDILDEEIGKRLA